MGVAYDVQKYWREDEVMQNATKRALGASLKKLLLHKSLDKITYDTWQEGMCQIFEAVLENKPFIMNVYRCVSRDRIENYLYKLTFGLIVDVVEEKCIGTGVTEEDKAFIAEFYKYGFVGMMLDWIGQGMKADYKEIMERLSVTVHGNIANSIQNFEKQQK